MENKTCRDCHVEKPVSAFSRQSRGRNHLQPYCRQCASERGCRRYHARKETIDPEQLAVERAQAAAQRADRRSANPEETAAKLAKRRASKDSRYLLERAEERAARKGLPFSITLDDVVIPERCPVLGIALKFGGSEDRDYTPTIDQVVACQGYIPRNVRVISFRANRIKSDATLDELRRIAAYVEGALQAVGGP